MMGVAPSSISLQELELKKCIHTENIRAWRDKGGRDRLAVFVTVTSQCQGQRRQKRSGY